MRMTHRRGSIAVFGAALSLATGTAACGQHGRALPDRAGHRLIIPISPRGRLSSRHLGSIHPQASSDKWMSREKGASSSGATTC